jgi:hypothetical protein
MTEAQIKNLRNNPHLLGHYLGYKKLNETHSQWILNFWDNEKDYVLQAHRNSYKTTACLVVGTIWYLLFHPETTILIVRKEADGASSIVKSISKLYDTPEMLTLYKEVGYTELRKIDDRIDSITLSQKKMVTKEGNIDSIGIGGSVTGRHYDKILCDDISTLKDRVSKAEREKTNGFVRELMNIKKATGTISFSGTPWHKKDVFSILPEAEKFPLGSIDIPELTPEKIAEIRSRTTASLFAINYTLKHVADENKIFIDAKTDNLVTEHSGTIAHIDCAYSGTHYTALTIGQKIAGNYIIKGYTWRKSIVDLYDQVANIMKAHNVSSCYMEDNADKGLGRAELSKRFTAISGYHESENKHNKIIGHLKYRWPEVYFDPDTMPEYLNQVLDYEEGLEPDDCPDSAACVIRQLNNGEGISNGSMFEMFDDGYKY